MWEAGEAGRTGRTAAALAAAALVALSGCVNVSLLGGGNKPLVETVVQGETGPKILLLEVDGTISEAGEAEPIFGLQRPSMVALIREQLDKAREDDLVRALLVRVNSPGGTVTGSDIVYRELLRFKEERGVPVVAQLMGVAASGGYYVAMAADRVIAHPTSVTGSIGVIFVGINLAGLMEKIGIEDQTLTTGAYKDAGSPLRPMRPAERQQLQSVLDDMHARFEQVVVEGRGALDAERVHALADGRIFSAAQALELGMVDELGDLEHSIAVTERLAGLESSRVVRYHRPREWVKNVYARPVVPSEITIRVEPPGRLLQRPGFLYLWAPGAW
jgi:protease-4